jgi:hypothetical protein
MKIFLTTLMAVALLAAFTPAHAAMIQVQYQIMGFGITTCGPLSTAGPVTCPNVAGPPLNIEQLGGDSNSPGSSTLADVTGAAVDILNNSSISEQIQIHIFAGDFVAPTAPPNITVLSHIGGTVLVGGGGALDYLSCVDPNNRLQPVSSQGIACQDATVHQTPLSVISLGASGAFQDTESLTISSLTGPYSVGENFVITLSPGTEFNFSASTTLQSPSPIPEPSTVPLLGSGLLGLVALTRKRLFRK